MRPAGDESHVRTALGKASPEIAAKRARPHHRNPYHPYPSRVVPVPAAVYMTDPAGKIIYYNRAAAELAGRTPEIGRDEWCVTYRLRMPDGTPLPHDECPMAVALKENRPVRGVEAVAQRPDGTLVPFLPFPTPIHDEHETLIGAVNMLVDISERMLSRARCKARVDVVAFVRDAFRGRFEIEKRDVYALAATRGLAKSVDRKVIKGLGYPAKRKGWGSGAVWYFRNTYRDWKEQLRCIADKELAAARQAQPDPVADKG